MPYVKVDPQPLERRLSEVAIEIIHDYQGLPSFVLAKPYALALLACHTDDLGETYRGEPMGELVRHLLANLRHWKGTRAKRVKHELRQALADYDQKRKA
jgi:hypothetical protein